VLELESWVPHDLNGVVHKSGGPWTIAWQRSVFVASGIPSGNRELTLSARASKVGLSVSSFQGNINKLADKHEIYIYIFKQTNKPFKLLSMVKLFLLDSTDEHKPTNISKAL